MGKLFKGLYNKLGERIFKIHKYNPTNPAKYGLEDENNELREGKYYEQELLRSVFNFELTRRC